MKVKDLVNSCQNQWKGLFDYNPLFKITFNFQNCENIEKYNIKEFNDFGNNKTAFYLMEKRHNQEVLAWEMTGLNDLLILVKEF